jgi:hypothetical protein
MNRYLIVLALVGLLAACTTTTTGSSAASGPPTSSESSAGATESGDASGTSSASAACTEAFAPIAELGGGSLSDLGDLDEVNPTVDSCESVADWIAGAEAALGATVNPNAARLLLEIRCADPAHADAPVCEDLAAS